jgi:hypothetical protein
MEKHKVPDNSKLEKMSNNLFKNSDQYLKEMKKLGLGNGPIIFVRKGAQLFVYSNDKELSDKVLSAIETVISK